MNEAESDVQAKEPPAQPVERLLSLFGGAQALARALDLPVATVEEWRARGSIPRERSGALAEAAAAAGIDLEPEVLAAAVRAAPTIDADVAPPPPEPEPEPEPEPQTGREAPRWFGRLPSQLPAIVFGGLLVVAGFLLAMGTSSLWLGPPTDWADRLEELEEKAPPALEKLDASVTQLEQLQQQVALLQKQVQALPAGTDPGTLDNLSQQILAEVDRRLAAVPSGDAARLAALEDGLAQLGQKLDELARQQAQPQVSAAPAPAPAPAPAAPSPTPEPAADAAALAAAVTALARQVAAGAPYATELGALDALSTGRAELAAPLGVLGANANEGIATLEALRGQLADLAPAILRAAREREDGSVLDDMTADLSLLLGGRPVGDAKGDSVDARVARAELRLEEGDLAAALGELKGLPGAAAEVAQPWVDRAEARLASLAAVEQLQQVAASGN